MPLTRTLPRMYYRRLALIASTMVVVVAGLTVQLVRLTTVRGAELRDDAESALEQVSYLATYRGSILDRHGRVLAEDVAGHAVALHYSLIVELAQEVEPARDVGDAYQVIPWSRAHARRQARLELGRRAWGEATEHARSAAVDRVMPFWIDRRERVVEAVQSALGVDFGELARIAARRRDRIQGVASDVQRRRFEKLEVALGAVAARSLASKPEPIHEQRTHHQIAVPIDADAAFELRRVVKEIRILHPVPEDMKDIVDDPLRVEDARRRSRPWLERTVELPRDTLPSPLRSDEPVTIHVRGVADHIIGYVRPAYQDDIHGRWFIDPSDGSIDRRGYADQGDRIGAIGIEASMEQVLRGERGFRRVRFGASGEQGVRGEGDDLPHTPGRDVTLTIDYDLQATVQAVLSADYGLTVVDHRWHNETPVPPGAALDASAVVLDVASGEILAMVSTPEWSSIGEARERLGRDGARPWIARHLPTLNRPVEACQPPGSIVKPLVLAAAITDGVLRPGEEIECVGHFFPNVQTYARCWIYREQYGMRTHGSLGGAEAIGRSCNIFFYTLADRLGARRLVEWYTLFGAGAPLESGLQWTSRRLAEREVERSSDLVGGPVTGTRLVESRRGELGGQLPRRPDTLTRAQVISMGIGQQWTWTPLHAANAFAILARGGRVIRPTMTRDPQPDRDRSGQDDLHLDPTGVSMALAGLRMSVGEVMGTGHHIVVNGEMEDIFHDLDPDRIRIWGKTGTAEAAPFDFNGDGTITEPERQLDHAWFVGLVGPDRPEFAVAVLVDFGGSGGRMAGPIAHQVIRALMRLGYLPSGETEGGA